MFLRKNR